MTDQPLQLRPDLVHKQTEILKVLRERQGLLQESAVVPFIQHRDGFTVIWSPALMLEVLYPEAGSKLEENTKKLRRILHPDADDNSFLVSLKKRLREEKVKTEREIIRLKAEIQKIEESCDGETREEKWARRVYLGELRGDLNYWRICYERLLEVEARIEKGKFGVCEICGEPISDERLDAILYASECIQCAEAKERAERRRR